MIDYIIIGIIMLVVALSAGYLIRQKKKGVKCVGCPDAKKCSGSCSGCNGCCNHERAR